VEKLPESYIDGDGDNGSKPAVAFSCDRGFWRDGNGILKQKLPGSLGKRAVDPELTPQSFRVEWQGRADCGHSRSNEKTGRELGGRKKSLLPS
jgi:hypothetical protein